jgi:hypothetical protein
MSHDELGATVDLSEVLAGEIGATAELDAQVLAAAVTPFSPEATQDARTMADPALPFTAGEFCPAPPDAAPPSATGTVDLTPGSTPRSRVDQVASDRHGLDPPIGGETTDLLTGDLTIPSAGLPFAGAADPPDLAIPRELDRCFTGTSELGEEQQALATGTPFDTPSLADEFLAAMARRKLKR